MTAPPTPLVAHQGGWDELLIIAVPLALYGLVRLWERYRGPEDDEPESPTGTGRDR